MKPKRCADCGGVYSPKRSVCPRCAHTSEPEKPARNRPESLTCPECAERSPGTARFCVACEYEFRSNAPDLGRKPWDLWWLRAVGAGVLGALLIGLPVLANQPYMATNWTLVASAFAAGAVVFGGLVGAVLFLKREPFSTHDRRRRPVPRARA
jgi:hypothetical protein